MKTLQAKLFNWIKSFTFPGWSTPLALLILCMGAFGIFIPLLGVYWDDWELLLTARLFPPSEFIAYSSSDRPLVWVYIFLASLLGSSIVAWQIATLLLRGLTVLAMGWFLLMLWPRARRQIFLTALLFAVYPVFIDQPIAVSFAQHWLAFGLYFFSMGFMLQWVASPRRWYLAAVAVLCQLLHMTIFEYFWGLELLRLLVLWLALQETHPSKMLRLKRMLLLWMPHLIPFILLIGWRLVYASSSSLDPNRPELLFNLISNPLQTFLQLAQIMLQDMVFVLVSCWYTTLDPAKLNLSQPIPLALGLITLALGAALVLYVLRLNLPDKLSQERRRWLIEALAMGICATLLGLLPIWSTGRQVSGGGLNADRFALPAMFGAALVITTLVEMLLGGARRRAVFICLLVGLAVGLHLQTGNDYRSSWSQQLRIYWQLYWRAPAIQAHTPILSNGQLFPYVMPTFAFNALYLQPQEGRDMYYWYYLLEREYQSTPEAWLTGKTLKETFRQFSFESSTQDSLILHYDARFGHCLWMLGSDDADTPYLSDLERQALPLSDLTRILPDPTSQDYPTPELFGREPSHEWCYYFEKAELASQQQDWAQLNELGNAALEAGYHPNNSQSRFGREWKPFIEGFARSGQWDKAQDITISAFDLDANYAPSFCALWQRLNNATTASPEKDAAVEQVADTLSCTDLP